MKGVLFKYSVLIFRYVVVGRNHAGIGATNTKRKKLIER